MAELSILAQRRIGEILIEMAASGERDQGQGGDRVSRSQAATVRDGPSSRLMRPDTPPTLAELGVTKSQSHRYQQQADRADAIKLAKRQGLSDETIRYATEISLYAERKLGAILAEAPKATGTAGTLRGKNASGGSVLVPPEDETPTLADLGITKKTSARAQKLAATRVPSGALKLKVLAEDPRLHP